MNTKIQEKKWYYSLLKSWIICVSFLRSMDPSGEEEMQSVGRRKKELCQDCGVSHWVVTGCGCWYNRCRV